MKRSNGNAPEEEVTGVVGHEEDLLAEVCLVVLIEHMVLCHVPQEAEEAHQECHQHEEYWITEVTMTRSSLLKLPNFSRKWEARRTSPPAAWGT